MKNSMRERVLVLRITYKDGSSTFQDFLHKENCASFFHFFKSILIHHKNLQILATEMFKMHRR